jgi:hypothetical protein
MDWPLTGAVGGTLVLAGATTAWLYFIYQSAPEVRVVATPPSATLMPTTPRRPSSSDDMRPVVPSLQARTQPVDAGKIRESASPYLPYDSTPQRPPSADGERPAAPSLQPRTQPPDAGRTKASANPHPPYDAMAKAPPPPDRTKPAALTALTPMPVQPQASVAEWRAVATAHANSSNLGGHLDRSGIVDSLGSSYLRDALKNARNYNKLPPDARALIDAPTINLSRLAPYRGLLGIDDSRIELEQGVRFVRVASTRGVDDADLEQDADAIGLSANEGGDADLLVLPPIR